MAKKKFNMEKFWGRLVIENELEDLVWNNSQASKKIEHKVEEKLLVARHDTERAIENQQDAEREFMKEKFAGGWCGEVPNGEIDPRHVEYIEDEAEEFPEFI